MTWWIRDCQLHSEILTEFDDNSYYWLVVVEEDHTESGGSALQEKEWVTTLVVEDGGTPYNFSSLPNRVEINLADVQAVEKVSDLIHSQDHRLVHLVSGILVYCVW